MRKAVLTISLVVPALTVMTAPAALAAPTVAATTAVVTMSSTVDSIVLSGYEVALVTGVNNARAAAGVPRLRVAGGATDIARRWSVNLANSTTLRSNPDLGSQLDATGSPNWRSAAENVAVGSDPAAVVATYLTSAKHRANILDRRFTVVGVGAAANSAGRVADVLDFVDSADACTATTAPGYEPTPPVVQPPPPVSTAPAVVQPPVTTRPAPPVTTTAPVVQPSPPAVAEPTLFEMVLRAIKMFLDYFGIVIPALSMY